MTTVVIDDHLLRDVLTGERPADLGGIATSLATTGLWLFRLTSSWADTTVIGKLSAPVAALRVDQQERFLAQLVALPPDIAVLHLRDQAWPMALLQHRHCAQGRTLSAAMAKHWPPPTLSVRHCRLSRGRGTEPSSGGTARRCRLPHPVTGGGSGARESQPGDSSWRTA